MSFDIRRFLTAFACSVAVAAYAPFVAGTAFADPASEPLPAPNPMPAPAAAPAPAPAAAPAPAPATAPESVLALSGANAPAPTVDPASQAASDQLEAPPNGVPHLPSPDALPPGSTMDPTAKGNDSPNVSYLKDLWQAVQNHDISGKEALLMGIAQRGMNTPYPDQAPGPNVPTSPAAQLDPAVAPPLPPVPAGPPPADPVPPASPPPPTP
jgi:resuscitation-promoting factor RpfA